MGSPRLVTVCTFRGKTAWPGWSVSATWGVAYARHADEWRLVHLPTGRGFGVGHGLTTSQAERVAARAALICDSILGAPGDKLDPPSPAVAKALSDLFGRLRIKKGS